MADSIIRVLAKDAPVKASAITARDMVERARQIHRTLPVATAALGRALMACSMMGNQLKEEKGSVTLQIKGAGPLGRITVVSDSSGNARGYVQNPQVDLPLKGPAKLDVGSAVGLPGALTVIKDLHAAACFSEKKGSRIEVSISNTKELAVAFAVLEGEEGEVRCDRA